MTPRKILVIEDEILSAERLIKLLHTIDDTFVIDGPLRSVAEVTKYMQTHNHYDIIFSDIRLTDGDVFEAFQEISPSSFVIFTTAYDEYAMQAIKNYGIEYLLKPIDEDELSEAIKKVRPFPSNQDQVNEMLNGITRYKQRLLVNKGDELLSIPTKDVYYFCKRGRCMEMTTCDGNTFQLQATMQELESQLDPDVFFRLNRQYIISIHAVRKIHLYFNSKLLILLHHCDDENIIVSRERSALFKDWLNK